MAEDGRRINGFSPGLGILLSGEVRNGAPQKARFISCCDDMRDMSAERTLEYIFDLPHKSVQPSTTPFDAGFVRSVSRSRKLNVQQSRDCAVTTGCHRLKDVVCLDKTSICGDLRILRENMLVESFSVFSSARANACVWKGKWMYEVTLETCGIQQLGWTAITCPFTDNKGVGDAEDSYAFDGKRVSKWNKSARAYGQPWVVGDVIGCCIDLDASEISFYRNGVSLGVAFQGIRKSGIGLGYYPAISLSEGECCYLNFGARPFRYPVSGFSPIQSPPSSSSLACYLLECLSRLLDVQSCDSCGLTSFERFRKLKRFASIEHLLYPISHGICAELFSLVESKEGSGEYIAWGSLTLFLLHACGKNFPQDHGAVDRVVDLFLEFPIFHTMFHHIVASLSYYCRTAELVLIESPATGSYPYLALGCHMLKRNDLMILWWKSVNFEYSLEGFLSRKGPSKLDLQHLIPCVWWPGSCEDTSSESSMTLTTTTLSGAVNKIEELQRELCRIIIKFVPPVTPVQLPGSVFRTFMQNFILKTRKTEQKFSGVLGNSAIVSLYMVILHFLSEGYSVDDSSVDVQECGAGSGGFLHRGGQRSFPIGLFLSSRHADIPRLGGSLSNLSKSQPVNGEKIEEVQWNEGYLEDEDTRVTHSTLQKPCCCSSLDFDFTRVLKNPIKYTSKACKGPCNPISERSANVAAECSGTGLSDHIVDKPSSSDQPDTNLEYWSMQHLENLSMISHPPSDVLREEELLDNMLLLYHVGVSPNFKQASYYMSHLSQSISLLDETDKQIREKACSEQLKHLKEARNVYREELADCVRQCAWYRISLYSHWKLRGMYALCMWISELLLVLSSDDNLFVYTPEFYLESLMETPPTNVASGGDSSFYVPPGSTDPAWQFGYLSNRADSNTVTCRLCKKVVKGGIYRFKQHLAHRKGNVAACPKVDEETKKMMISYLDDVARKKSQKAIEVSEMRDEIDIGIAGDAGSAKRHRSSESLEQNVAVQGTRQMSIKDALSKDHRERVVSYICNWAYTSAIPFNAFTTKQFKQMVEAIGMYGPGLKTPTRYEISGPFLKKAVKKISDDLQCHRITWKKTGCSIMTDAWTDMRGRSIMNFCVNCSLGTSFLKSIDASDETHTADYIFQLVDECINEVGVDSVVQVVADNASANVAAGRLLLTKYPQIWWTSCAAHSIDLALEEISRDSKVKSAVKKARTLTIFIYAHTKTLSLMRKFTNKRDIARPGQTRFATTFLTLESILEKKDKLRLMFSSDEWRACKWYKTKKGEQAASIVFSPTFWNHTAFAIKIFTPLVRLLRVVDADCRPSMGFVYGGLEEAKREIIASLNSVESSYKFFVDAIISKTKGRLDTPLHLAAYFLNPYFFFTECGGDVDIVVKRGFMACMERFYPDLDIQDAITTKELLDYRHGRGAFGKPLAVRQRMRNDENFDPANWWYNYGDDVPHLKNMAIKILSLTSASSGCERNWSTFDSVDCFHAVRRSDPPFASSSIFIKQGLTSFVTFIVAHFDDPRISSTDLKDLLLQSISVLMQYKDYLVAFESNKEAIRRMPKALLSSFDNRSWILVTNILVRLCKGSGFGSSKHGESSSSTIFPVLLRDACVQDEELFSCFLNRLFNTLSWTMTEFSVSIREMQERCQIAELQQKKCSVVFDLCCSLIRVLEFCTHEMPQAFLFGSDMNLRRLTELIIFILNHIISAINSNFFDMTLRRSGQNPEKTNRAMILAPLVGIILNLADATTNMIPGNQNDMIGILASMDCPSTVHCGFRYLLGYNWGNALRGDASMARLVQLDQFLSALLSRAEMTLGGEGSRDDEVERQEGEGYCCICYASISDAQFEPCHHISCFGCISRHLLNSQRCFFCNATVVNVVKTGKNSNSECPSQLAYCLEIADGVSD